MSRTRAARWRRLLVVLAALAVMIAACGGQAEQADEAADDGEELADDGDQAAGEEDTAAAEDDGEPQTVGLWHYEAPNSAMGVAWAEAMEQFEAQGNVTVAFEEKGFEQIRQTANMVLNSAEAPNVMEYNKGNASAGLLSTQGLLTDITEEVEARGWDQMLSPSIQTTSRYDEQGIMGSGSWYGVTNYAEYVMVYYNQDMFNEHGVEVPSSLAEFESVMDTFVEAGIPPIALGATEYPAQQIFYALALTQADREFIDAFQMYQGEIDFHGPEFTFGAERMAEWVEKGYISQDATGINAEDMAVSFTNGTHPILISGSWWYGRFVDEITDFEWGTFLFPDSDYHMGSGGNLWVVPEGSENKELAYEFIDLTMTEEIQNLLGEAGGVPVAADPAQISDPKSQELISNFNTIADGDGLAFYPDWPVPGYYDMLVGSTQNLISGTPPDQVLDEMAAPYEEHVSSLGE